jgi:glycosyltransferase involved in cell wall biosynthesis
VSLTGQTILCLATQAWDAHWTPVQQVMLRLAGANQVIYFEPFRAPLAWLKKGNERLRDERRTRVPQLREVAPNLLVYRPGYPYLPWNMKSAAAARANGVLYAAELRALLKRLNVSRPWLWAYFAQSLSVLNLDFERIVYDCVDEWPAFFPDPVERQWVTRVDEALCRRADLVFVGSKPLLERKAGLNPNTFVVNHAADVSHFAKAFAPETIVPPDLDAVPRPRLGFVGMMDAVRFDMELIGKLAADPQRQIVLVGGVVGDAGELLPTAPNIHRLGMKRVEELPAYLKGLDVLLMPYRLNDATRHIYPLKLHEYLATGKPVVTTRIPAVEGFEDLMYVADDGDEFERHVRSALTENDPDLTRRRQTCAKGHSWEAHVERKAALVAQHLSGRTCLVSGTSSTAMVSA